MINLLRRRTERRIRAEDRRRIRAEVDRRRRLVAELTRPAPERAP